MSLENRIAKAGDTVSVNGKTLHVFAKGVIWFLQGAGSLMEILPSRRSPLDGLTVDGLKTMTPHLSMGRPLDCI